MHVAWLGKKSPFCGNVTYSRQTTHALLERNYQVSFLHFARTAAYGESWPHCHEVALPFWHKSQIYTIPAPRSSQFLARALAKLKPDVVHASLTLSPLDFRLPDICQELGIPLIATFHPPFDSKLRNFKASTLQLSYRLYAPFLARYDRAIVFSRVQRDLLERLGVPAGRLAVIPNGVDAQQYSPGPSNFKQRVGAERLFVYQGRISAEKNLEALLQAWQQCRLGDRCKLVIVGDGPLLPLLKPLYGKASGIIWLGFVADEQQRIDILRAADVFVLPSFVEGLSLSLLEAMSCGVACLATDAGADGEVLASGAGVILSTQDTVAQLRTLLPLCRDRHEVTDLLGQRARQRVLERYTLNGSIALLESLYAEVRQPQSLGVS
ncbi:glycosyltransferase [Rubidibacter lacunae KORDI 51-2]|uniref:Glycosyltransferase n=1 Tax=Rubidibacter lacunae KORDI 51-2 TaxID=582515 RepID=U5DJA5_9CHRO|nr:glycosyltransferase family 4 protein [Rubidibacter lacunae]ERN41776.1 glycosyltransferase [Rubidibacter lacunae KORDI 51-2]